MAQQELFLFLSSLNFQCAHAHIGNNLFPSAPMIRFYVNT